MNWMFHKRRKEWSCEHGVGHYDPRLVKFTAHGCDGCCARDDFPGKPSTSENLKTLMNKFLPVGNSNGRNGYGYGYNHDSWGHGWGDGGDNDYGNGDTDSEGICEFDYIHAYDNGAGSGSGYATPTSAVRRK